ncbi:MAG: LysR family transcriptional regulator [Pseudomonadota bacterium]
MRVVYAVNLRHLDLNLLLVFDAVFETGSNTRAGEKLGLTQSAASNALRRLRVHLGDPLFERQGANFVATPEAKRLAPVIREALKSLEQSIAPTDDFDPVASERRFKILTPDPLELTVLAPLVQMIIDNGWGVNFDVEQFSGASPMRDLNDRSLDIAFLPNPVFENNIRSAFLYSDDAVIIARRDHPVLGELDHLAPADMAKVNLVALPEEVRRITHLENEMRVTNTTRRFVATVRRLWSIPNIVSTTDLAGAISRRMAETLAVKFDLKILPVPLPRPAHDWHMAWHEEADADPGNAWLRSQILSLFPEAS